MTKREILLQEHLRMAIYHVIQDRWDASMIMDRSSFATSFKVYCEKRGSNESQTHRIIHKQMESSNQYTKLLVKYYERMWNWNRQWNRKKLMQWSKALWRLPCMPAVVRRIFPWAGFCQVHWRLEEICCWIFLWLLIFKLWNRRDRLRLITDYCKQRRNGSLLIFVKDTKAIWNNQGNQGTNWDHCLQDHMTFYDHTNGTVTIRRGPNLIEIVNIRCIKPA